MSIATVQFLSKALARQTTYTALLPDASVIGAGPYPVLYQLHGSSDSHSVWLVQTGIARYVSRLPLIVVMPEGAPSAWPNHGETEQTAGPTTHGRRVSGSAHLGLRGYTRPGGTGAAL